MSASDPLRCTTCQEPLGKDSPLATRCRACFLQWLEQRYASARFWGMPDLAESIAGRIDRVAGHAARPGLVSLDYASGYLDIQTEDIERLASRGGIQLHRTHAYDPAPRCDIAQAATRFIAGTMWADC